MHQTSISQELIQHIKNKTTPKDYSLYMKAQGLIGQIGDNEKLFFSTEKEPVHGDIVVIHPRHGHSFLAVMEGCFMPGKWKALPYCENSKSDVHAIMIGTMLEGGKQVIIPLKDCLAIHRVVEKSCP